MLIGSVARPLSGASMVPTMPAVATSTRLLPPASACATASTSALRRARRSPAATSMIGSASADISERQRPGMPHDDRARLLRMEGADLAEGRLHLVDHEIDDVAR